MSALGNPANDPLWREWAADRVMRRIGKPLNVAIEYRSDSAMWIATCGAFYSGAPTIGLAFDNLLKLALEA